MTDPLRLSFEVDCTPAHAFEVWTADLGRWWPRDHTLSGAPAAIVLESGAGGRIFERTTDGRELDWGWVTVWEPPSTLGYQWHIGREASEATEVEIRFEPTGSGTTRVEVEHRGWERLGAAGAAYRQANIHGWDTLVPHFRAAVTGGAP